MEGTPTYSSGNRHEKFDPKQIREMITMHFTESTMSLLASTSKNKLPLPKIKYVTVAKNIYLALSKYNLDASGDFSNAVGFDIKKPNKEISPEGERNAMEFFTKSSCELLNHLREKAEDQLTHAEKSIIDNYISYKNPEGWHCANPEELRDLLKKDWEKRQEKKKQYA
jgi:hypothetical protein